MGQWKFNPFTHKLDYYPEDGDIDHGGLAGLADDDHTQYLLADGTRTLAGNLDIDGNIIMNGGGDIRSTSNGNVRIVPSGTGITQIGDAGSQSAGLVSNDDLFISGKLEVDGVSYIHGTTYHLGTLQINASYQFVVGPNNTFLLWSEAQTTDTLLWGLADTTKSIIFTTATNRNIDHDHGGQANPTIFIHSVTDPDTDNTQWMSLRHDTLNSVIDTGKGALILGGPGDEVKINASGILRADEVRAQDADGLKLYNAAGTNGLFVDVSGNVGNGTENVNRKWHVEEDTSLTNTVRQIARYTHTSTGTPASGIGVGLEFELETAAGNNEIIAGIEAIVTDVNATKEDGALSLKTMSSGNLASEKMRIGADEIDVNIPLVIGNFEFDEDTGIATAMDMPVSADGSGEMGYEFKVDGENIFRVSANSDSAGGVTNERVRISGMEIQNALTTHKTSQVVADNAEIELATGVTGWGFVQAGNNEEHAQFSFTEVGAVTLISNTANVTTTGGTDNKLNIYDDGAGVAIENKLGAAKKIRFDIHYS